MAIDGGEIVGWGRLTEQQPWDLPWHRWFPGVPWTFPQKPTLDPAQVRLIEFTHCQTSSSHSASSLETLIYKGAGITSFMLSKNLNLELHCNLICKGTDKWSLVKRLWTMWMKGFELAGTGSMPTLVIDIFCSYSSTIEIHDISVWSR